MKVLKAKRKNNTVELEVETPLETLEEGLTIAFKRAVKHAKIPGFRKGKAPRAVFEKYYGKGSILQEGISEAVNIAYSQAIEAEKIKVVDYPRDLKIGEYKENEPLTFSCEVDVKPEIKLDKYKGLKVEKESDVISDDLVDVQLKQIQQSSAEYELVDRAAEKEDLLKVNVEASIDGEAYSRWSKKNVGVCIGTSIFSEKFDENLIGRKTDEPCEFSVEYAADYHLTDVAGKTVSFKVTILEIKGKTLPELTDELVKKASKFETVDALKTNIRESLESQRKTDVQNKLHEALTDQLIENHKMDIPKGMIDEEVRQDKAYYESTLNRSGSDLGKYLDMIKQTDEEFTATLSESALKRIKIGLILDAIKKKEKIEATEDDVVAAIQKEKPELDTKEKALDALKNVNRSQLEHVVTQRKVFDFLVEHAKIKEKKA